MDSASQNFDKMYRANWKYVQSYCMIASGVEKEEAEDMAQEVFMRAWRNRSQMKESDKHRMQLANIAYKVCYERKSQSDLQRNRLKVMALEHIQEESVWEHSPRVQASLRERYDNTRATLRTLKPEFQEVLELKMQGLTENEIADQIGINLGTVKSRLHYAKRLFDAEFSKYYTHHDRTAF